MVLRVLVGDCGFKIIVRNSVIGKGIREQGKENLEGNWDRIIKGGQGRFYREGKILIFSFIELRELVKQLFRVRAFQVVEQGREVQEVGKYLVYLRIVRKSRDMNKEKKNGKEDQRRVRWLNYVELFSYFRVLIIGVI